MAVPRLIQFGGVVTDNDGKPLTGTGGITFALYKEPEGGVALWMETQNVHPDNTGRYMVLLGSTSSTGLPSDLFVSGDARWLGVRVEGQEERPRTLLLSVPYALKAGDAETVGGLPPSAFVLAAPASSSSASTKNAPNSPSPVMPPNNAVTGSGTAGLIPVWDTTSDIISSVVFQSGSGGTAKVGINTTAPKSTLDIGGASIVRGLLSLPNIGTATATSGKNSQPFSQAASAFNSGTGKAVTQTFQWQAEAQNNNTANASATLNLLFAQGTNKAAETGLNIASNGLIRFATGQTFPGTGKGTITGVTAGTDLTGGGTGGNVKLNLDTTKVPQLAAANIFTGNQIVNGNLTATGAVIGSQFQIGSNLFAFGSYDTANVFLGFAGNTTTTGYSNTATGTFDLFYNTTGYSNTVVGASAGYLNTTGYDNVAVGNNALGSNGTGNLNTALGNNALLNNATGSSNTAVGDEGLSLTSDNSYNIAVGYEAGASLVSGDNNIYIGNPGIYSESNTIRIGTGSGDVLPAHTAFYLAAVLGTTVTAGQQVFIGYDGRLGTINSSRRYKDDIEDMGDASLGLMQLRPVTFRYKQPAPDGSKPLQYGLVAEEVAEVYPDVVAYNSAGQPDSVEYHKINAMLLNEVQRQHREIEDLKASVAELKTLMQSQRGK